MFDFIDRVPREWQDTAAVATLCTLMLGTYFVVAAGAYVILTIVSFIGA